MESLDFTKLITEIQVQARNTKYADIVNENIALLTTAYSAFLSACEFKDSTEIVKLYALVFKYLSNIRTIIERIGAKDLVKDIDFWIEYLSTEAVGCIKKKVKKW